ncbi:hypothetical protein GZ77_06545 [Endozoicomonas montiporae]|uniref:Uncharacterized protein n=1 Tax=Endozoicomonas montiporae TaxID=1027273 RepID=A0A081MYE6_9GAMM|nr:hypothetical protein GZ77_26535 [Endozoicomonas montiporae]KEQ12794.1 hypothetical protein GZ77_20240 [Endozoicomonas montiporae]KEQ16108.1 hypothetical protein GZ77_06545 [Endozoicomonas montiporae]
MLSNSKHQAFNNKTQYVLKKTSDDVLEESKNRGWDYFCFAALPDCLLGKQRLKRHKYLKIYMTASGAVDFLWPKKNKNIFDAVKKPGQLAVLHVNKSALSCISSGGYQCGYLLVSVPNRHWFTAALVLSNTDRPFTDDDLMWLQSVSWRFMQYRKQMGESLILTGTIIPSHLSAWGMG